VFATDTTRLPTLHTPTNCIAGTTGLGVKERLLLPLPRFIKRLMDLVLVLAGGIVIVPLLVSIAIAIKLTSPGPVFYRQRRLGTDNTSFWAWKFRSMVSDADEVLHDYLQSNEEARREWELDHKLKHDPRVTSVGRLLRKTSLDELPQLWNVLRSEMSLVGPRPIVNAEISKYDSTYRLYSRVKPGITGLWQISGRNDTTYQQRVNYDGYYARNWSPWLDIYILVRTIKVVFFCEGAY
jgi:Undecaprenyl-phosphate galactose phosphotransferase WbaP